VKTSIVVCMENVRYTYGKNGHGWIKTGTDLVEWKGYLPFLIRFEYSWKKILQWKNHV